jgi:hypothetical protein
VYRRFTVFTDHKARLRRSKLSQESKRIVRFWLKLSEFGMTVKHLDGVEIAAADTLRRYVAGAASSEDHSAEILERHIQTGQDHGRPHMG